MSIFFLLAVLTVIASLGFGNGMEGLFFPILWALFMILGDMTDRDHPLKKRLVLSYIVVLTAVGMAISSWPLIFLGAAAYLAVAWFLMPDREEYRA